MVVSAMGGKAKITRRLLQRVLMLHSWVQIWSTHAEVVVMLLVCYASMSSRMSV